MIQACYRGHGDCWVAGDYFTLLGVESVIGRMLAADDDRVDAALAAVISERLWERAFGRNPDVIGGAMQLGTQVFTIVGVAPARFRGRSDASMCGSQSSPPRRRTSAPRAAIAALRPSRGWLRA